MEPKTAAILVAASTAVSAAGALASANASAAQSKYNAALARQEAERQRQLAAMQEADYRDEQEALLARQRAVAAGSGRVLTTGTPLLNAENLYREIEYEAAKIKAGGAAEATRLENQATLYGMKARSARTAGFFSAGTTLLTGIRKTGMALDDIKNPGEG